MNPDDRAGEPVGSVGEEALRLLGALNGWAREHDLGEAAAAAARDHLHAVEDPAVGATPGAATECTWCPVCRGLHLAREASPEVRAHLATAATAAASLLQAAAGILSSVAGDPAPTRRSAGVEHVDLDGDDDRDDDRADDGADDGDRAGERRTDGSDGGDPPFGWQQESI